MSDDIFDIVDQMIQISQMDEEEKRRLEEIVENMSKLTELDDYRNMNKIDFEFEEIDFDEMDDVEELLEDLNKLPLDDLIKQDVDISKESIEEYFDYTSDYKYDPEPEEVEVNINEDEINDDQTYHGETWVEFESGYETFIEIPQSVEDGELDVTLNDDSVIISEPVGESVSTEQLPSDIESIDVNVKDENLLIRVE